MDNTAADTPAVSDSDIAYIINKNIGATEAEIQAGVLMDHDALIQRHDLQPLTSTLSHLKALILFAINLKLHTTAFAFLKALLLFLFGFCLSSGFIRFCLNSAQTQYLYAASLCAPAWRPQRYKSLVARA